MRVHILCMVYCIITITITTSAYKILTVFPTSARSHFIIGQTLSKGLADAGHDVTMISPYPQNTPIKNYRDINVEGIHKVMESQINNILDTQKFSIIEGLANLFNMGVTITNYTLTHEATQALMARKEHFDVVIVEIFVSEALIGLGHYFQAPVIGISTFGASRWTNDLVGTPTPLSYVPSPYLVFSDKMTFLERIVNTLNNILDYAITTYYYMPMQNKIYNTVFRDPKPDLDVLRKNVSLVLLNTHVSLSYPRPYVPNMIEVGGMHLNRKQNMLPTDLKSFLDSATDGAIYFSMGSNIRSAQLPIEKRNALIKAFSERKEKVLWKWESDILPGKPNNLLIRDWFPQDDVLAHPNVKVFMTHGGLLSSTEAVYHGVPIIGIPIYGDQSFNMERAVNRGYGLTIKYQNLTYEAIKWALDEMLSTDSFSKQIKLFSERFRDQPLDPLQHAIYWIEYVARHKGAPHLRCAGLDLHWFSYHSLDVFATIFLVLMVIVYGLVSIIYRCFFNTSASRLQKIEISKKKK